MSSAIRSTGAYWFLPALFAASCVIAATTTVRTGYATSDIASASYALYIGGPLTAGFVAARCQGFTRFLRTLRARRTGISAAYAAWWGLLVGAPVAVCLAVVSTARALPTDAASWSLLLVDFMTVMACGLAFAWALPIVVAVPMAPSQWARAPRLVVAPAVALVLAASFGLGSMVALASPGRLTIQAVQPRTTGLDCSTEGRMRVCLWPENTDRARELADRADDLSDALRRWHLETIVSLTQAGRDKNAVSVSAGRQLSADDIRYTVAAGYVDHVAGCEGAFGPLRDERVALLMLGAGDSPQEVSRRFDPAVSQAAQTELSSAEGAPEAIRAWFMGGIASIRCGPGA